MGYGSHGTDPDRYLRRAGEGWTTMYCDNCTGSVQMGLEEYIRRTERFGAVRCSQCRTQKLRQVEAVRPRA